MMKYHLPARPIYIDGESPGGVLIRAVEGNYYPNLTSLINAYWQKDTAAWALAAFTKQDRFTEIMEAFGIRQKEGEQPFYKRIGPTSESARLICDMEVPEALFREDVRYFCPHCLKGRAFWRKLWMLKPYSVCPEHHVYLLRDCPSCGKKLDLTRCKLTECECGADLKKPRSKSVDISALTWWLDCHMQDKSKARMVDMILIALKKIDGGEDTPKMEHRRLHAVYSWVESRKIERWLVKWIDCQADSLHPRIQLLPLLRGKYREMHEMAEVILGKWKVRFCANSVAADEYLRRCEAELSLGISAVQFNRFENHRLLEFPDGRQRQRGKVSLAAINKLLFDMQALNCNQGESEGRGLTTSLATMVSEVLSGIGETAGYNISTGLRSLRRKKIIPQQAVVTVTDSDWINVLQMAEILDTYPEVIRFLCRKGWIPSASKKFKYNQLMALKCDVEAFNAQYVLGGSLAGKMGANRTNFSEKLMAVGLKPVAGPSVDGSLVYLFDRADIDEVDLESLRQLTGYPTKTGRKPGKVNCSNVQSEKVDITAVEAAKILGIKHYEVLNLIRRGILVRLERLDRDAYVSRNAVQDLYRKINSSSTVSIEIAAQRLNLSVKALESKWIMSGVMKVHDFGLWRLIERTELEALERQLETHLPAKEAGYILSMHRSHLPNMEGRGEIKSKTIGKKKRIRLYARADIGKLVAIP